SVIDVNRLRSAARNTRVVVAVVRAPDDRHIAGIYGNRLSRRRAEIADERASIAARRGTAGDGNAAGADGQRLLPAARNRGKRVRAAGASNGYSIRNDGLPAIAGKERTRPGAAADDELVE